MQPETQQTDGRSSRFSWTLPASSRAPEVARLAVAWAQSRWGLASDDFIAPLLVTEVVTNALLHSFQPMRLSLTKHPDGRVLFEVSDNSPVPPRLRHTALDASRECGLLLVEKLADSWGYRPTNTGKVVWIALTSGADTR